MVTAVPSAPGDMTGESSNEVIAVQDEWSAYGWPWQPHLLCARMQPAGADPDPDPSSVSPEAASRGGTGASDANSYGNVGAGWGRVDGEVASEGADPSDAGAPGMVVQVIYDLAEAQ